MGHIFDRAKDIFIENRGSQDLMLDNGCLDEYTQFKVSKGMEYAWKDEFIEDQFNKASSHSIRFADLVCGVCLMAGYYGNQSDYQKIFSIRHLYLNGLDMIDYIMYLNKVLDSIRIMLRNNEMTIESKLETHRAGRSASLHCSPMHPRRQVCFVK